MELTQTNLAALLATLSLWAAAQAALLFLLWPLSSSLDDRANAAARLWLAVVLSTFCLFLGPAAAIGCGLTARLWIALSPFLLASGARLAFLRTRHSSSRKDRLFLVGLAVFCVAASVWGIQVPLFHYDGLLYHLPTAALVWQQGTLFVSSAHPQIGSNPVLPELAKVWAFSLAGNDSLAQLQQLPALAALAALAYSLALRWGSRRLPATFAAVAVLLAPKAFEQALSPNVDLYSALLGSAAAMFLARKRFPAAAVALLLFAQLKYTTLLPALAGAAILGILLLKKNPFHAVYWAIAFTFLGGAWEWHNWTTYGNPTRPYQILSSNNTLARLAPGWFVEKADPEKWQGYYVNGIESVATGEKSFAPFRFFAAWGDSLAVPYDSEGGRWGPAWFALAVPALFLFLAHRRKRAPRELLYVILFTFLTVKSWEARFGFLMLPFGFASAARALSLASKTLKLRALPAMVFLPVLAWCLVQIAQSHPIPALASNPRAMGLELTTRDAAVPEVLALAAELNRLAPGSVWIDFTQGERHHYGMASTLLYPYFSSDWSRSVWIRSSRNIGNETALREIRDKAPGALLLQAGSTLNPEDLGYRKIKSNPEGSLYARP